MGLGILAEQSLIKRSLLLYSMFLSLKKILANEESYQTMPSC